MVNSWSTGQTGSFESRHTKEIQRDFTKFAVTFEPKVQITQNKNLVKAIVNIYYIIVNSYQTFMPVPQKKTCKSWCAFIDTRCMFEVITSSYQISLHFWPVVATSCGTENISIYPFSKQNLYEGKTFIGACFFWNMRCILLPKLAYL